MKIAVTTPTGQVGSKVADNLLDAGAEVLLLTRSPEKARRLVHRGGKLREGALEDRDYLVEATRDADALFWVTPPSYNADDLRRRQGLLAQAAAAAILANRIPRVVNLSSIGAHLDSGAGPISGLHDVEEILGGVAENITHLRPGQFFENYLWQLDSIRDQGAVFLPINGTRRMPMIATADIARVAADWLLDDSWTEHWIRELHGPADLSFDEAAAAISEGIGRMVSHVECTPDDARRALLQQNISAGAADSLVEMYEAIQVGRIMPTQKRTAESTTPTTMVQFAREVIRPLIPELIAR